MRFVLLFLQLCLLSVPAFASVIPMQALTPAERNQVNHLIKTDIRQDMQKNFHQVVSDIKDVATGEPMDLESQAVLIKGMYESIRLNVEPYGLRINEAAFTHKLNQVLSWSTKYGLSPSALTIGAMGHAQYIVGAGAGMEFTFYLEKGNLKVASYRMFGLELGVKETLNMEFYAALCFGNCSGGAKEGAYIGLDGMAAAGLGGSFYINVQLDVTDLIMAAIKGKKYSVKELYQSRAINAGFAFDVGEGLGLTGSIFYYQEVREDILVPKGRMITEQDVTNLKLH